MNAINSDMLARITYLLYIICYTVAGDAINKLNNSVYGIIAKIPVPFPGFPPADIPVCSLASDASSKCPINNGDSYTEKVTIPVPGPDVIPISVSFCIVYIHVIVL